MTRMDYEAVVAQVWTEVMPGCGFDPALNWNEAGVDSLKSLHYLFRLEQITGQKISFDLFARDVTPGHLIRSLSKSQDKGAGTVNPDRGRTLFLFPGIFGDEQRLANFRWAIRDEVVCETLEVADIHCPAAILSDINATTAILVKVIQDKQPEGPVALAGYSFGGVVAYQASLELRARGRDVDFLCLLDTLTASFESASWAREQPQDPDLTLIQRLKLKTDERPTEYMERFIFKGLQKAGLLGLAQRFVLLNWGRLAFSKAQTRRRDLILACRVRALRRWRPSPSSTPTLLVASDDCIRLGCDRTWASLCQALTVQHVASDHWGIFEPGPLERLVPALLKGLGQSGVSARERVPAISLAG